MHVQSSAVQTFIISHNVHKDEAGIALLVNKKGIAKWFCSVLFMQLDDVLFEIQALLSSLSSHRSSWEASHWIAFAINLEWFEIISLLSSSSFP